MTDTWNAQNEISEFVKCSDTEATAKGIEAQSDRGGKGILVAGAEQTVSWINYYERQLKKIIAIMSAILNKVKAR